MSGGYQTRRANPYAQQDDRAYEMSDVKDSTTELAPHSNGDSMATFYSEVCHVTMQLSQLKFIYGQISSLQDSLRTFNDNVARIGDLHSRSLNNMDDSAAQRNASQLDELVEDTSALSASLKKRIKDLERQGGSGRDGQIRKQQVRSHVMLSRLATKCNYTDCPRKIKVCGSHSTLPDCRATIPYEV